MAVEDLMKGKRGKENEARKVGMYLVKELCDLRLQEIAERFGARSYGAVGGMSRSRRQSGVRHKVSGTGGSHPPNLPTKDLTPHRPHRSLRCCAFATPSSRRTYCGR